MMIDIVLVKRSDTWSSDFDMQEVIFPCVPIDRWATSQVISKKQDDGME